MKNSILALMLSFSGLLHAHCQMPCGIYHDDMVFDQIDQYVETMVKAVSVMNGGHMENVRDKNEFCRWVIEKENECNHAAEIFTKYFLQQKIKPGEEDTPKKLESAHKLLFLMVAIKQNADPEIVHEFNEEWNKFKLMFHIEGYECLMEKRWMKELDELRVKYGKIKDKEIAETHDHSHDHPHEH